LAFWTVTVLPLVPAVPFQTLARLCPEARVQPTLQERIAAEPAVTVTSPWKPPAQVPVVRSTAEHLAPEGLGVTEGVTEGEGVTDGETVGVTVAVGSVEPLLVV
jgi:hypothetical protein